MTAFNGGGGFPNQKAMTLMAGQAGLANSKAVYTMAALIYEIAKDFSTEAPHLGVPKVLADEIQQQINARWQQLNT